MLLSRGRQSMAATQKSEHSTRAKQSADTLLPNNRQPRSQPSPTPPLPLLMRGIYMYDMYLSPDDTGHLIPVKVHHRVLYRNLLGAERGGSPRKPSGLGVGHGSRRRRRRRRRADCSPCHPHHGACCSYVSHGLSTSLCLVENGQHGNLVKSAVKVCALFLQANVPNCKLQARSQKKSDSGGRGGRRSELRKITHLPRELMIINSSSQIACE